MRVVDAGHSYLLDKLDGDGFVGLDFVKREGEGFPFNIGNKSGTNCQEVLRALIDRSQYLNKQMPCAETEAIIGCLQSALLLFELRAARRHNRHLTLPGLVYLSNSPTCQDCLHIGCKGDCNKE